VLTSAEALASQLNAISKFE